MTLELRDVSGDLTSHNASLILQWGQMERWRVMSLCTRATADLAHGHLIHKTDHELNPGYSARYIRFPLVRA